MNDSFLIKYRTSSWIIKVCLRVSVGERWRVEMKHWHIACISTLEEGMKHAALITIFIHQPVSEADSLFISDFTAVSLLTGGSKPDCNEHHHVGTSYSHYFRAPAVLFCCC